MSHSAGTALVLDVLSADEEAVLCRVRNIVADLRVARGAAALGQVKEAVVASGAAILGDADDERGVDFRFGEVRFSLRQVPDGIEINFTPGPS